MDLPDWLSAELKLRGWTVQELARRSGLAATTIGDVLNDKTNPGATFCLRVAEALNFPADVVFRHAGLLPEVTPTQEQEAELLEYFQYLTGDDRDTVIRLARALYERRADYTLREKVD
jgi:transcriptional regulator with XRE-family HTH domain